MTHKTSKTLDLCDEIVTLHNARDAEYKNCVRIITNNSGYTEEDVIVIMLQKTRDAVMRAARGK